MTVILEIRNVCYSYGDGTEALKEVSISLEEGKKIALVGPNGAGKSTLLLMFNGILAPTLRRSHLSRSAPAVTILLPCERLDVK